MKYIYIFLLYTLSLNAQLLTPTMMPQTLGGLRQFSQNMSGRANYNNRGGFSQTVIPNRMMPYAAGIQNQQRPQQTLNQHQQPQVLHWQKVLCAKAKTKRRKAKSHKRVRLEAILRKL